MGPRRWTALALIALAVVALFFALRGTHSDKENAPGWAASQATIKPIPSNPDLVTPRHPDLPPPQGAPAMSPQSPADGDGSGWLLLWLVIPFVVVAAGVYFFIKNSRSTARH
jgi:hypothetical protein